MVDFHKIWYAGDTTEWDLDTIIFNLTTLTILKWLMFKFMMWMHCHSALLNNGLGLISIVCFPWLHHIPSLADITTETKACIFL
jgi:hypothetical protein